MRKKILLQMRLLFFAALIFISSSSSGQGLKVAAATDVQGAVKVLTADFTKKTGIVIITEFGEAGNLAAQIRKGVAFDIFLSDESSYPQILYSEKLTIGRPVTYASSGLIICSTKNIGFENWERLLLTPMIKKIAMVNPQVSPYGRASDDALAQKGVWSEIRSKVFYSDNIQGVNTAILSGYADLGFTTRALIKEAPPKTVLYYKILDPRTYTPVEQGMALLKHAAGNTRADRFFNYMVSADAQKILREYGYIVN